MAPDKIQFRYQLEGFDKTWIEAGARRAAYYTNMPPGKYTFRVMAANSDEVWNEAGASVSLTLQPHLYQTYYFYGMCVVSLVLLGLGSHRLHIRHLKAREVALRNLNEELEKRVVDRTLQLEGANKELEGQLTARQEFEQQLAAGSASDASTAAILSFSGHGEIYQCNGEQPLKPLPDSLP